MIIATRHLVLRDKDRDIEIPVRIHAPERSEVGWICRFEIEWPEGRVERWGSGNDAMQALLIAMQMIGTQIYTSHHHEAGRLEWLSPGLGYGFPVPNNVRDLLVGDDLKFL
jgi:hypothetical protein